MNEVIITDIDLLKMIGCTLSLLGILFMNIPVWYGIAMFIFLSVAATYTFEKPIRWRTWRRK